MRTIELTTALDAPAQHAWQVLLDVDRWPEWGVLVVSAEGRFAPGARWTMHLRDGRRMRPTLITVEPTRLVFETYLGHRRWVCMQHSFQVEELDAKRSMLRQRFEVRGVLVPVLWRALSRGMRQFDELGCDLARRVTT
ncbi:MAG: SRPBCC domain-containing protein [Deltaproteobacteria bacterium]|nr:SRPBCC domain-containing protein [Deltaproteobacteria bacterium]